MSSTPPPLSAGDALFLDFDGTLAELSDHPDAVHLAEGMGDILIAAASRLGGALALVSGRDLLDLSRRVPTGLWRIGNHGLFSAGPGTFPVVPSAQAPAAVVKLFDAVSAVHDGTRVETKGPVLTLHFRAALETEGSVRAALQAGLSGIKGYSLQAGKFVFEAKPDGASKGAAILQAMERSPFRGRQPVMFGDDVTDEDGFAAIDSLDGWSVKVGAGNTQAGYRLPDVAAVHEYLREFVGK